LVLGMERIAKTNLVQEIVLWLHNFLPWVMGHRHTPVIHTRYSSVLIRSNPSRPYVRRA